MVRIVIIHDHPVFISGIKAILRDNPSVGIIGESSNTESVTHFLKKKPDLILLSERLNGVLKTIRSIQKELPRLIILVLVAALTEDSIRKFSDSGVHNVMPENVQREELVNNILVAHHNENKITLGVQKIPRKNFQQNQKTSLIKLTSREIDILHLLNTGIKEKEIAVNLRISLSTVKFHISHLFDKFDARNSRLLLKYARDKSFVD